MPKHLRKPSFNKGPHINLPSNIDEKTSSQGKKPVFSFHNMDKKYEIQTCEKDEKCALIDKLRQLSEMTWLDIMNSNRHACGCEIIENLKVIPPSYIPRDVKFLAFRFDGKKPMIGYRQHEIFHIIWLDREFKVYDHG